MIAAGQSHRFRDSVALYVGTGETVYTQPGEARALASALLETADSVERERFTDSPGLTRHHSFTNCARVTLERDASGRARAIYDSACYSYRWPPAPNGGWRVACYVASFQTTPVVYRPHVFSDHRTLGAAVRRLAHLIARQSRRDYRGERFGSLYIVAPDGERLPLNAARERLAHVPQV